MLVNAQQAAVTIQKTQRTDLDPANAAASTLFSGALQTAQNTAQQTATATQKSSAVTPDINAAFAKTRVQLQATQAPTQAPKAASTADSQAMSDFKDYMSKTPEQRMREAILQEMGLSEESFKALPPEKQLAVAKEITDRLQERLKVQVAQKAQDSKADEVKAKITASL